MLALRASGLDGKTAHFIHRPNDIAMFGWSEDDPPVITDVERAKWQAAEALTDQLILPAYAVLDEAGQTALVKGINAIQVALTG